MRAVFDIEGLEKFTRNFRGAASDIQDASDAWPEVAGEVRKMGALQIASAGTAGGTPYPALRPSTLRFKARRFPGKAILRRTDEMFRAVAEKGAPGSVEEIEPDSVTVGVTLKKARLHHGGTPRMAARQIYVATPRATEAMFGVLARSASRKLEGRGFEQ